MLACAFLVKRVESSSKEPIVGRAPSFFPSKKKIFEGFFTPEPIFQEEEKNIDPSTPGVRNLSSTNASNTQIYPPPNTDNPGARVNQPKNQVSKSSTEILKHLKENFESLAKHKNIFKKFYAYFGGYVQPPKTLKKAVCLYFEALIYEHNLKMYNCQKEELEKPNDLKNPQDTFLDGQDFFQINNYKQKISCDKLRLKELQLQIPNKKYVIRFLNALFEPFKNQKKNNNFANLAYWCESSLLSPERQANAEGEA